ncbi:hypothetical protein FKM82_005473 [Ascaphus truei]
MYRIVMVSSSILSLLANAFWFGNIRSTLCGMKVQLLKHAQMVKTPFCCCLLQQPCVCLTLDRQRDGHAKGMVNTISLRLVLCYINILC